MIGPKELGRRLHRRFTRGLRRLRSDGVGILWATFAAALAYGFSEFVLGHQIPMQAAVAAWITLGFTPNRNTRKVLELAIGVSVGVGLGELFYLAFGAGVWQIAAVLLVAAGAARILDAGPMLTTQAGVQAIVILTMAPILQGGPLTRWTDSLVGGGVALLVAALAPLDVRKKIRRQGRAVVEDIAKLLAGIGAGLAAGDGAAIRAALGSARDDERNLDAWRQTVTDAVVATKFTPAPLRHDVTLTRAQSAGRNADHAMRSARVLARRAAAVAGDVDGRELGALLGDVARAVRELAAEIGTDAPGAESRAALERAAGRLNPHHYHGWQAQSLVALSRSLLADLLLLAGASQTAANAALGTPVSPQLVELEAALAALGSGPEGEPSDEGVGSPADGADTAEMLAVRERPRTPEEDEPEDGTGPAGRAASAG